ncbi:MAG: hypothetical protein Q8K88_07845 [Bradyrhizobium sp.]|nr:hypothetical protein [Bradyrhizobium sp.]
MRRFILLSALLLASASLSSSSQAQGVDVGSIMSANGISAPGAGQSQLGSGQQAGSAPQAAGAPQASKGRSAKRSKQSRTASRESARETKARGIAAKYGVTW